MNRISAVSKISISAASLALAALGAVASTPAAQAASLYSYTEDFEDGALNTPGVSVNGGSVLGPGSLTDSVQGANPGSGSTGRSYYSSGAKSLSFTFNQAVLGALPTTAGITWTDVGYVDGDTPPTFTGVGTVVFSAYDAANVLLETVTRTLGDGLAAGETAEDSIFSYTNRAGIGSIKIEMPNSGDWEVDNLAYSAVAVPTPALLPGLIGMGLAFWRKRKGEQAEPAS